MQRPAAQPTPTERKSTPPRRSAAKLPSKRQPGEQMPNVPPSMGKPIPTVPPASICSYLGWLVAIPVAAAILARAATASGLIMDRTFIQLAIDIFDKLAVIIMLAVSLFWVLLLVFGNDGFMEKPSRFLKSLVSQSSNPVDYVINNMVENYSLTLFIVGIVVVLNVGFQIKAWPSCVDSHPPKTCTWSGISFPCLSQWDRSSQVLTHFVQFLIPFRGLAVTLFGIYEWSKLEDVKSQIMTSNTVSYALASSWVIWVRSTWEFGPPFIFFAGFHNMPEWHMFIQFCWPDAKDRKKVMLWVFISWVVLVVGYMCGVVLLGYDPKTIIAPSFNINVLEHLFGASMDFVLVLAFASLYWEKGRLFKVPFFAALLHVLCLVLPLLVSGPLAGSHYKSQSAFVFMNEIIMVLGDFAYFLYAVWSPYFDAAAASAGSMLLPYFKTPSRRFVSYYIAGGILGMVVTVWFPRTHRLCN